MKAAGWLKMHRTSLAIMHSGMKPVQYWEAAKELQAYHKFIQRARSSFSRLFTFVMSINFVHNYQVRRHFIIHIKCSLVPTISPVMGSDPVYLEDGCGTSLGLRIGDLSIPSHGVIIFITIKDILVGTIGCTRPSPRGSGIIDTNKFVVFATIGRHRQGFLGSDRHTSDDTSSGLKSQSARTVEGF